MLNMSLFNELDILINKKRQYQNFITVLKTKPRNNQITLAKELHSIYFDESLIPVLINYFENEIKILDEQIEKFKLTKTIE